MKFQDALFNWLQIYLVAQARPEDQAAADTEKFFADMLREDHELEQFSIGMADDTMYHIHYVKEGKNKIQMYDREAAEQLLEDIKNNPKYNE